MLLMESPNSLTVDLADPASIRAKLPEAEKTLADLERALELRQQELARWRDLVSVLRALAPDGPATSAERPVATPTPEPSRLSPLQALVIGVVNRENRKIKAKQVAEILQAEGHDVSGDSVSNTLWVAAEKIDPPPIKRAGHGFYAPLIYNEPGMTAAEMAGNGAAGVGTGALIVHALNTIGGGAKG
jgi:hypothetical protein